MKILIVGLGSIAHKHITAIRIIEPEAQIYALRSNLQAPNVNEVINVFNWEIANEVDFIIISNPTNNHTKTVAKAIEFRKPLFIEKPVFGNLDGVASILDFIRINNIPTYVGCVLRFNPVIRKLKEIIQNQSNKIDEVNVYCGSYLPNWRPSVDFRKVYSAIPELGGGVHLDMIHEIDYVYWLFGRPLEVKSTLKNSSHLNLDVVDYANYQLIYEGFTANVVLNYFRKKSKREIEIVSENFIYIGDLINYTITDEMYNVTIYTKDEEAINLYELQMRYFIEEMKKGNMYENDAQTGVEVLKLVLNR